LAICPNKQLQNADRDTVLATSGSRVLIQAAKGC
jgi:hypothetical protein